MPLILDGTTGASLIATTAIPASVVLSTPASGTMTNVTSVPAAQLTGTVAVANGGTGVATSTGSGANALATSPTLTTPVLSGSVTGTYTLAGTPTMGASLITSGTAVASTSGTSIDFTSIPSWVKRITFMLSAVQQNTGGVNAFLIKLGTSSGIVSTGYTGGAGYVGGGPAAVALSTGFNIYFDTQSTAYSGFMTIALLTGNTWVASGVVGTTQAYTNQLGGTVSLGGTLDRVRLTTNNGSNTFVAGSVNIQYE